MKHDELEQEVDKLRQTVFTLSTMMNKRDESVMKSAELVNKLAHICDSLGNVVEGVLKEHKALRSRVEEMLTAMQKVSELGANLAAGATYQEVRVDKLEARLKQIESEMPSTLDHAKFRQQEVKAIGWQDGKDLNGCS